MGIPGHVPGGSFSTPSISADDEARRAAITFLSIEARPAPPHQISETRYIEMYI